MSSRRAVIGVGVFLLCLGADSGVALAQSGRVLAELGKIEPPAHTGALERTAEPSYVFDDAMKAYDGRRYERAADQLRRFVTVEPEDPAGNFFLAVSLMMTDEVGEAEDRLGVVIGAGATPFEFPARYVRAKAWIRLGRLDAAEQELQRVAASSDPYARSADDLLARVRVQRKRE